MSSEWQLNEKFQRKFKDVYTNGEHWRMWDREGGPTQKIGPDQRVPRTTNTGETAYQMIASEQQRPSQGTQYTYSSSPQSPGDRDPLGFRRGSTSYVSVASPEDSASHDNPTTQDQSSTQLYGMSPHYSAMPAAGYVSVSAVHEVVADDKHDACQATSDPTKDDTYSEQPLIEPQRETQAPARREKIYRDRKENLRHITSAPKRRPSSSSSGEGKILDPSSLGIENMSLGQSPPSHGGHDETKEAPRTANAPYPLPGHPANVAKNPKNPLTRKPSNPPIMQSVDEDDTLDLKNRIKGSANTEKLDHRYKKRQNASKYFEVGQVFAILWTEPHGDNGTDVSNNGGIRTKFGQTAYSGIRRMVVVKERKGCCWCVPIVTYSGQGTAKAGIDASSHAIIYMSDSHPARLPQETGMTKQPISVEPAGPDQKLDQMSRINFGKMYTVEHNVRVMSVGKISEGSRHLLVGYFDIEVAR